MLESQVEAEPGRYQVLERRKEAGQVLTVSSDDVVTYGLGQVVDDQDELQGLYGLRGKSIREDGPTWVDALVTTLTDPFVSWMLLFVGLFMLVVELKLPGIGLPAITSALAFLLFFWSHYLSGTADQLEIILFLVGLICLALELFVFPGFGVFGMSGVLLILVSIVMASHTFVWPTQEYEYREMGLTLLQVTVAMTAVGVGAVVLARFFPSIPLFNRLILKPEPWNGIRGWRRGRQVVRRGVRLAALPDRRDGEDHDRAPAGGARPLRRDAGRRHLRRVLHRGRQPGRGRRRPGVAGGREEGGELSRTDSARRRIAPRVDAPVEIGNHETGSRAEKLTLRWPVALHWIGVVTTSPAGLFEFAGRSASRPSKAWES